MPSETKGYKCRHGRIFETFDGALQCDLAQIISECTEKMQKAADLFFATTIMDKLVQKADLPRSLRDKMLPDMCVQEIEVIVHWIMKNLTLLETMIQYKLDADVQRQKLEKEQATKDGA